MSEFEANLTIGQVAAMSRLTIRALRHYDEIDLLAPARVDPSSGYRFYFPAQVTTASTIAVLRSLDVDISTIRQLLLADADVQELIQQERARLQQQVARTTAALGVLDALDGLSDADPEVVVQQSDSFVMLGKPVTTHASDDLQVVGEVFEELFSRLDQTEIEYDPDGVCVIHRSDRDTLALEVGVQTSGDELIDGYRHIEVAGGEIASMVHLGPLQSLPLGHARLATWVLQQGLRPAGSPRETFLGDLSDQRTMIGLPVTALS